MTVYLLATTASKASVGSVVGLRLAHLDSPALARSLPAACGAAILTGAGAGVACLLIAGGIGDPGSRAMLTGLAFLLPIMTLQDSLRYIAHALGDPTTGALNSGSWLCAQVTVYIVLASTDYATAATLAAAWASTSVAGTAVALLRLRIRPSVPKGPAWFAAHRPTIRSLAVEYALIAGVSQGAPLILATFSGLAAVGAFRGAITLLGPITVASHGVAMASVPKAAQQWHRGDPRFLSPLIKTGALLMALCVACGITITFLIPDNIGEFALNGSWQPASEIAIFVGIWLGLGYATEPALSALRITEKNAIAARVRLLTAPITVASVAIGAQLGEAQGAAIGLDCAGLFTFAAFWMAWRENGAGRR